MKLSDKTKKILVPVVVVVLIIYFVLMNTFGTRYSGSIFISEGEWTGVTYEVESGSADKFSCELNGTSKLKVSYDGNDDLFATLTFTDDSGHSQKYSLKIYEEYNTVVEHSDTVCDLEPIE